MALFGKKPEPASNSVDIAAEKIKKEKESICEQLRERQSVVEKIVGSKGRGGLPFAEKQEYLFHIEEDEYVFDPIHAGFLYWRIEDLRKAADTDTIRFPKQLYRCELEHTSLIEQRSNSPGEFIVKIEPIKVVFENTETGERTTFSFHNLPQNISGNAPFFKELGVKNFYNIVNLPEDVMEVKVLNGNNFVPDNTIYIIFRNEGKLCMLQPPFCGASDKAFMCEIGIDEVLYYKQEGALRYEQQITGSGGGSTNYTAAIVGGLLFGAAGALIGSRANEKETTISTEIIEKDTRLINLAIKKDGTLYLLSFDLNAELVFDWIIPDKEYSYVISKRREAYEKDGVTSHTT